MLKAGSCCHDKSATDNAYAADSARIGRSVLIARCEFSFNRQRGIGVRGSVAVHRLANPVTLCDGHEVFFVAASGQIWRFCREFCDHSE